MHSHLRASLLVLAAVLASRTLAGAQVTDGDEQFQAYHQDIGRISGSPTGAQVGAPTLIRQVTAAPAPSPAASPLQLPAPATLAPSARATAPLVARRAQATAGPRPASRVTLAVRTQLPVRVEPLAAPVAIAAIEGPSAQFAAQLVAPAAAQPHPQQGVAAGSSVSARHSALIAQVAAERQQQQQQRAAGAEPEASAAPAFSAAPSRLTPTFHSAVHVPAASQEPAASLEAGSTETGSALAAAAPSASDQDAASEPPSFEHVLSNGCPARGVFSYENKDHCDRYYMCTNGTFTEEACPNGLAYGQMGAVYQHCAYNWNVDCGSKKTSEPLASPGCPWQFGIFPIQANGRCSVDYFVCEWGVPETRRCSPEGLFYDDRIKGCQWADQLGCKSEGLLNFKCPAEDEDNPYWPYPRYYHNKQDIIVCVNEQPRLVHCTEDQVVDAGSLSCLDLKKNKSKKKLSTR